MNEYRVVDKKGGPADEETYSDQQMAEARAADINAHADRWLKPYTLFDAVQILGMRWPKSGKLGCPLHVDKTASLQLYAKNNSWYCFSCHKTGDAYGLIAAFTGADIADVLRQYGNRGGFQRVSKSTLELVGPQVLGRQLERAYAEMADRVWKRLHEVFGDFQTDILVDEIERMSTYIDELHDHLINRDGEDDVLAGMKKEAGNPPPIRTAQQIIAVYEKDAIDYLNQRELRLRHPNRFVTP